MLQHLKNVLQREKARKYANMDTEKKQVFKERFCEWMSSKIKGNSFLLKPETYSEIVEYLKAKRDGGDLNSFPRKIKRRIASKKFELLTYPILGLKDVLCTPKELEVRNIVL